MAIALVLRKLPAAKLPAKLPARYEQRRIFPAMENSGVTKTKKNLRMGGPVLIHGRNYSSTSMKEKVLRVLIHSNHYLRSFVTPSYHPIEGKLKLRVNREEHPWMTFLTTALKLRELNEKDGYRTFRLPIPGVRQDDKIIPVIQNGLLEIFAERHPNKQYGGVRHKYQFAIPPGCTYEDVIASRAFGEYLLKFPKNEDIMIAKRKLRAGGDKQKKEAEGGLLPICGGGGTGRGRM